MADSKDYEEKSPSHETVTVAMPSTESQSAQHRSVTESAQFKVVTPKYKTGDKISSEINLGGATVSSGHTLRESNGEYRSEHAQEQFKMHVIDPKVNSNAYIPAHTTSSIVKTRTVTEDFPSHHNKRSLLKLDPVEQRKFRSVETRPITTNAYLSESLNRHRAAEESKLKQYLKAKEGDANQPWNKPDWPGASQNQESLRELEQIRKSIETLQKVSAEPRSHDDLEELSRKSRELAERSKSRRSEFKLVGSEIVKTEPEAVPPPPQALKVETKPWPHMPADLDPVPDSPQSTLARQYHEERYSKVNHYNSMPALDTSASARGTTIHIQDEKQQQQVVMQPAEESESRSQLVRQTREVISSGKPRVTETIQRVEERKVTEETERRVLRRERKHRSHRSAHRSHHQSSGHQEAIGWHEGGGTAHRSSSASRGGSYYAAGNGYDRYGGYNPPPPPRDYPVGYHRGYEPTYYHTSYNGYDMPPAYPRRTASATLYH